MEKFQKDYARFFPFPEIREPQERAIDFILNSFQNMSLRHIRSRYWSWKKCDWCNCITIFTGNQSFLYKPDELENEEKQITSYFLTPQKILQKQYIEDFGCVKMGK